MIRHGLKCGLWVKVIRAGVDEAFAVTFGEERSYDIEIRVSWNDIPS
jgi:hypothetical protein